MSKYSHVNFYSVLLGLRSYLLFQSKNFFSFKYKLLLEFK